jgi:hypothetical protein
MRIFKATDDAFVVDNNGYEFKVRVMGCQGQGDGLSYFVQRFDRVDDSIGPFLVPHGKLLAPKGPFFDIRGQVLTTSASHPSEMGQIVGTATSKSGKPFFNVCFNDGKCEWFSEDQAFIDDEVKRAHDEATKDKEFAR